MKTVIMGASGLLGNYLMQHPFFKNAIGTACSKLNTRFNRLDLTLQDDTEKFLSQFYPEHIIHTVALTDVDLCEENITKAYLVNVETTKNIVSWIRSFSPKTKLTYISTDHLYNGKGPHSEKDASPSNVYSLTKLYSEDIASQVDRYLVLRVNFFGYGINVKDTLSDWIIKGLRQEKRIPLFRDVLFSPLHLEHVVDSIVECTIQDIKGVYNLGSSGEGISKAEFAKLIAEVFNLSCENMEIISVADSKLKTYRPRDMRMSVGALESALGHRMPTIREGVELMRKKMEVF